MEGIITAFAGTRYSEVKAGFGRRAAPSVSGYWT